MFCRCFYWRGNSYLVLMQDPCLSPCSLLSRQHQSSVHSLWRNWWIRSLMVWDCRLWLQQFYSQHVWVWFLAFFKSPHSFISWAVRYRYCCLIYMQLLEQYESLTKLTASVFQTMLVFWIYTGCVWHDRLVQFYYNQNIWLETGNLQFHICLSNTLHSNWAIDSLDDTLLKNCYLIAPNRMGLWYSAFIMCHVLNGKVIPNYTM